MTVTRTHRQPASLRGPRSHRVRRLPACGHRLETASRAVRVAELMTRPHVAQPDAPLLEIIYRTLSLGQREIVVVNGQQTLGVITLAALARLTDPGNGNSGLFTAGDLLPSRTPRLLPDQDLATAASIMSIDDADALPVVDDAGTLVGVLAARDVIAHVGRALRGREVGAERTAAESEPELVSLPSSGSAPERDDDIYGPASFPASDPPSTWAGP